MLYSLSITNYALINILDIEFSEGLTIITGETGAGKSIILGALSLVLGQKADAGILRDPGSNAVVEACFRIPGNDNAIEQLFSADEVNYSGELIIRRVIYPNGKSRSFVNDQPVNVAFLRSLGNALIDIHSQHESLLLADTDYPVRVADAFAGQTQLADEYRKKHAEVTSLAARVRTLRDACDQAKNETDYLSFQYQELQKAKLSPGEQEELEKELSLLEHAAEIRQYLFQLSSLLEEGDFPVLTGLKEAVRVSAQITEKNPGFSDVSDRMEQARIELKDLAGECARSLQQVRVDPVRMEEVSGRLDTIYTLQGKHNVRTVEDLLILEKDFGRQLEETVNDTTRLEKLEKELEAAIAIRDQLATDLHKGRMACLDDLSRQLCTRLALLGIPDAQIEFVIREKATYGLLGNTGMEIMFSANRDMMPRELSCIASGGEMSRLMLCIKSVIAQHSGLSTIIFDEVDLGVSGKIADRMGNMIYQLSEYMQVLAITHLPQVAAKGSTHYLVRKEVVEHVTETRVLPLHGDERVMEVARMLSGSAITPAAIQNAKELLNNIS
ncbi:MAG TPA: DNA repair protein RecN [Bacteroidales bacterium]|nr:DNA repair protein RecN [Bacteroidales bacterium]HOQ96152.1 DNA repair protein RecN [Bacteroidales bacterium]